MLRLFDKSHNAVGYITKYKDLRIESDVSTGDKTLSFTYLAKTYKIENEYYIQTKDDEYVVKEVSGSGQESRKIVAVLNLEELEQKAWQVFTVVDVSIDEAARLALAGTGWRVKECTVTKHRNAGMKLCSSRKVLQNLCTAFMCEAVYDTRNKTVSFYDEIGEDRGVYFLKGLNLKELDKGSDTYDYYTRIIPIGAEGLTIESINGGKNYLENYQYSSKVKPFIWQDESYTDVQALKDDAEAKLEDMSRPIRSFSAKVIDLAAQKPGYSVLSYHLGDRVKIIDADTDTMEAQRIVRMVEYPQEPSKNTCELANTVLTFEELQERLRAAAEIVNNTLTADGKIRVSDILQWEKGLAESVTVSGIQDNLSGLHGDVGNLQSGLATLDGRIGAISITVGKLDANCLRAEDAELKYAHIDLANIKDGCITNAMIGIGVVDTAQIADGSITDAKIVGMTASKITAGRIDAAEIEVVNLNAENITVGTINGQQIASGTIDLEHLSDSLGGTITTTAEEVRQALEEAEAAQNSADAAQALASSANSAAQDAQRTADGKNTVFYQPSEPSSAARSVGDTWYDTDADNAIYKWNGSTWEKVEFGADAIADGIISTDKITDEVNGKISSAFSNAETALGNSAAAQSSADTAQSVAEAAQALASAASTEARDAQTAANGKNTVFYQTSAPAATGRKTNDVWFDTDDGNHMYYWNGAAWTQRQFGTNAIANASITNALIADATIQSAKIANLDAAKITTGYLAVARIQAGSLTADKLKADTITAASGVIADAAIVTANIANLAVTGAKIADAAIGTAKIVDAAITGAKIKDASITNVKIADATIQSAKIASLDAAKITSGTISAARIGANTITANKLAIGDFTNYAQLNDFTYGTYGFTRTADASGSIYTESSLARDKVISEYIPCNGGEKLLVKGAVATSVRGASKSGGTDTAYRRVNVGIFCYDGNKTIVSGGYLFSSGPAGTSSAPWTDINPSVITVPANAKYFRVYIHVDGYPTFSGTVKVRNIEVLRMASGELIVDGVITAGKVAANAITAGKIAVNAVTAGTIAAGAVTADKLAANAVTAGKIAANSVTTATIASGAVNADKIAANAITAEKINAGAVTTEKIAAEAVTAAKIAAKTITANQIAADTITAAQIASGTITAGEIASGAITTVKLAAGAVTAEKISAGAVTADKIAANAITAGKIAADAVTAEKINVTTLSAIAANLGTVNAGIIQSYTYTYSSGNYSTSGMQISLSGAGYIRSRNFGIDTSGNAYLKGNITASAGTIGGFTLTSDHMYRGNTSYGAAGSGNIYVGTSGISISNTFKVSSSGALTATGVTIAGTIDATSIKAKDAYYIYLAGETQTKIIGYRSNLLTLGFVNESSPTASNSHGFQIRGGSGTYPNYYIGVCGDLRMLNGNLYDKNGVLIQSGGGGGSTGVPAYAVAAHYVCLKDNGTKLAVAAGGAFRPESTSGADLGGTSYRWTAYLSGAPNTPSDRRLKENIRGFSAVYEQAYMELRPSLYNFRNVKKDDHHDRIHGGFIAQEVETTLQKYGMSFNDFAFLCRDSAVSADEYGNPVNAYAEYGITDYLYSVKNEEMIAWNTHMTQKALRHQRKQDGIIARQTAQIEQLMRMNQMLLAQLTKTTAEA